MRDEKWAKAIMDSVDAGDKVSQADLREASLILTEKMEKSSRGLPARAKNQTELAKILKLERKTIARWKRENPETFPKAMASGAWKVPEVVKWMRDEGKRAGEIPGEDEDENSIHGLKMRQLRLMCEKLEHELAVKRGDYTSNKEVKQWVAEMVIETKTILLRIPSKLAPILAGLTPAEIEERLKEGIDEALAQLHDG